VSFLDDEILAFLQKLHIFIFFAAVVSTVDCDAYKFNKLGVTICAMYIVHGYNHILVDI
jgi:hypothetical protein